MIKIAPNQSNDDRIIHHDFTDVERSEVLISLGEKRGVDGWHTIQFSGGKKSPTKFTLSLFWFTETIGRNERLLLKLRTDVDRLTPPAEVVLQKLPPWCSLFGKSTSPHTLAFLSTLPVSF